MWFLDTMTRCWGRYLRAGGKGSLGIGHSNHQCQYRVFQVTESPACWNSDSLSTHPLPNLQNNRECRGLDQKTGGNIYQDFVYSVALSNDLFFIQNWVNRNSFAETNKHCTVQQFHKQLFNSPLPAFPDKRSRTSFSVERAVIALFMACGERGTGDRRTREVTLKLFVPPSSFPGKLCPGSRTMC